MWTILLSVAMAGVPTNCPLSPMEGPHTELLWPDCRVVTALGMGGHCDGQAASCEQACAKRYHDERGLVRGEYRYRYENGRSIETDWVNPDGSVDASMGLRMTRDDAGQIATASYGGVPYHFVFAGGHVVEIASESDGDRSYTWADGRLQSRQGGGGRERFSYDDAGRLVLKRDFDETHFRYDDAGRLIAVETSRGTRELAYDTRGRLERITFLQSGVARDIEQFRRDEQGRVEP